MEQLLKHNGQLLQIDKVQFMIIPLYAPNKKEQNRIASMVDKIIKAKKKKKPYSEDELNNAIYELFDIQDDEIKIIEGQ